MLLHFKTLFQWDYEMSHIWDHLQKLLYYETQIATFVGISKKIAAFLLKVLHFLGNLQICYFQYKLRKIKTYVKLTLFNQLLQSQFIGADILMLLDYLNLMRIINFQIYCRNIAVLIFLVTSRCVFFLIRIHPMQG